MLGGAGCEGFGGCFDGDPVTVWSSAGVDLHSRDKLTLCTAGRLHGGLGY